MVAQLMLSFLNSNTEAEMERLLGAGWRHDLVTMAPSVQSSIKNPRAAANAAMQVTLFNPEDEGFDPAINCPNNACSVAAILESQQVLMRPSYPDGDKRHAVFYLMHFMLQLHIPINAGLIRDAGGQEIYLKGDDLKPVNFSWIWNYDLYRRKDVRWFSYAQELVRDIEDYPTEMWVESLDPKVWAYDTHQIAVEQVYPLAVEGRYSADLIKQGQPLLEEQLIKAAYRSAALMNKMYGEDEPELEEQVN